MKKSMRNTKKELLAEIKRLEGEIDCACNALRDSICASGNRFETNMHWVRKLERVIGPEKSGKPK
jgi:hypothetical protein